MARSKNQRQSNANAAAAVNKTLILDNGGHSIKAGFSSPSPEPSTSDCHILPNAIARSTRDRRTYVASEIDTCIDYGELAFRRPIEKGIVTNWESEKAIWEHEFAEKAKLGGVEPEQTQLVLTEGPNAPATLQRWADEMVFEEFGFAGACRVGGVTLNAFAPSPFEGAAQLPPGQPLECLLVVDAGYSHTTVTPLYHGRPIHPACRRLEVGGKTLSNQLKAVLSRQAELQKEDWIANQIKEDCCFVSQTPGDFARNLERTWKGGAKDPRDMDHTLMLDYVLPDYENIHRGFARPHDPSRDAKSRRLGLAGQPKEDIITLANERFTVPELLFSPADLGMQQEGVVGTVLQVVNALPEALRQPFLANVLVVGGTSLLPGFVERLDFELRSLIDVETVVRVAKPEDPVKNAWLGGAMLASNHEALRHFVVTKQEYQEHGPQWASRKFAGKIGR